MDNDEQVNKCRKVYRKLVAADGELIENLLRRLLPLSVIAKRLGCDRRTLSSFIRANEELNEAYEESRCRLDDLAESKLIKKIEEGDLKAIMFYLETRCAHRGWGRKVPEPDRMGSSPIVFVGEIPLSDGTGVLRMQEDLARQV